MTSTETSKTPPAGKIRWGLLATGHIAGKFATGLQQSRTGIAIAAGSRSPESAARFAANYPTITGIHGSYAELLANPDVDAVYISPPHPMHKEWALAALRAGKHVLCEKPVGMNAAEAEEIIAAARASGRFFMEAFMYRCSAQTRKIVEIVKSGALGQIRMISAHFCFDGGDNPAGRLLNKELGGGGILDVGCYPASFCRLIAGAANGKDFTEPDEFSAMGHLGDTGVDELTTAIALFPGDIQARMTCGVRTEAEIRATIYGSTGRLVVNQPWNPAPEGGSTTLQLFRNTERPTITRLEEIPVAIDGHLYGVEADTVGDAILAGKTEADSPAMTLDDTLGNMRLLDRWRATIGIQYDADHAH
jgi:predicted dehydrogenase